MDLSFMTLSKTSVPHIPQLEHVALEQDGKKWNIVTARLRMVLGPRLLKSDEPWPETPHRKLTLETAIQNAAFWEAFIKRQENPGKKGKK
jgi:hypothetical protein